MRNFAQFGQGTKFMSFPVTALKLLRRSIVQPFTQTKTNALVMNESKWRTFIKCHVFSIRDSLIAQFIYLAPFHLLFWGKELPAF